MTLPKDNSHFYSSALAVAGSFLLLSLSLWMGTVDSFVIISPLRGGPGSYGADIIKYDRTIVQYTDDLTPTPFTRRPTPIQKVIRRPPPQTKQPQKTSKPPKQSPSQPKRQRLVTERISTPYDNYLNGTPTSDVHQVLSLPQRGRTRQQAESRHAHEENSSQSSAPAAVTEKRTLYDILGAPPDATRDELKRRYNSLAKLHHPDAKRHQPKLMFVSSNAAARSPQQVQRQRPNETGEATSDFQDIVQAWKTLSDDESRKRYDRDLQYQLWGDQASNVALKTIEVAVPAVASFMEDIATPFLEQTLVSTIAAAKAMSMKQRQMAARAKEERQIKAAAAAAAAIQLKMDATSQAPAVGRKNVRPQTTAASVAVETSFSSSSKPYFMQECTATTTSKSVPKKDSTTISFTPTPPTAVPPGMSAMWTLFMTLLGW